MVMNRVSAFAGRTGPHHLYDMRQNIARMLPHQNNQVTNHHGSDEDKINIDSLTDIYENEDVIPAEVEETLAAADINELHRDLYLRTVCCLVQYLSVTEDRQLVDVDAICELHDNKYTKRAYSLAMNELADYGILETHPNNSVFCLRFEPAGLFKQNPEKIQLPDDQSGHSKQLLQTVAWGISRAVLSPFRQAAGRTYLSAGASVAAFSLVQALLLAVTVSPDVLMTVENRFALLWLCISWGLAATFVGGIKTSLESTTAAVP
jgi:hypothetical protein